MEKSPNSFSVLFPFLVPVLAFIFGFGFAWMLFAGGGENMDDADKETITASDVFALPLGHTLVSVDEQEAGGNVFISLATLSRGAWIAIHEDYNGTPSTILGARYFHGGKTAGTIELLRDTIPGRLYYAVVHMDDGDRGFDFRRDEALRDPFGNMIMSSFRTLEGTAVSADEAEHAEY